MMGNFDDFEQDAGVRTTSDAGKAELAELARAQVRLEEDVRFLQEQLDAASTRLRAIAEVAIPVKMMELGIDSITLTSGEKVTVNRGVRASIPAARKEEALAWLRRNDAASLIKNIVTTKFGRGEDDEATALLAELRQRGVDVEQNMTVHPQTLGAFVRERIADGLEVPGDLLGVYEYAVAKIGR